MPDNTAIIKLIYTTEGVPNVERGGAALEKNKTNADKATQALGMSRREWMRTGNEAAYYATLIAGKSGEMGKSIATATGFATQLGESFMFGGGIGVAIAAIGTGISIIASQIQKAQEETDKLIKPFQEVRKEIEAITELKGIEKFAADIGISESTLRRYIGTSKEAGDEVRSLNAFQTAEAVLLKLQTEAQQEYNAALSFYNSIAPEAGADTTYLGEQYQQAAEAVSNAKDKLTNYASSLDVARANIRRLTDSTRENAEANEENARQIEKYKTGIPQAAQTFRNLNIALADLKTQHLKTESDLADQLVKLNEQAAERIGDIEENRTREMEDRARERADIERDYANEVNEINRTASEDEAGATWSEVQKIRRNAQRRRDELAQKKREKIEELNFKEQREDADYNKTANRARASAQAQIDEINKRQKAEDAAYSISQAKARAGFDEQMKQLRDTRTEWERWFEDLRTLEKVGFNIPVNMRRGVAESMGVNLPLPHENRFDLMNQQPGNVLNIYGNVYGDDIMQRLLRNYELGERL